MASAVPYPVLQREWDVSSRRLEETMAFTDIAAKMDRGRQHRLECRASIKQLFKDNSLTIEVRFTDQGDQEFYLASDVPDVPSSIAVILGDALQNFRSALDYLAWELDTNPGRHTMFQIAPTLTDFRSNRLKGMPGPAQARIQSWQPYAVTNPILANRLLELEELNNANKHRRLSVVLPSPGSLVMWQPGGEPSYIHSAQMVRGTTLARFPAGQHQHSFGVNLGLVFGSGEAAQGHGIDEELFHLEHVVALVLNDFRDAFFQNEPRVPYPG